MDFIHSNSFDGKRALVSSFLRRHVSLCSNRRDDSARAPFSQGIAPFLPRKAQPNVLNHDVIYVQLLGLKIDDTRKRAKRDERKVLNARLSIMVKV